MRDNQRGTCDTGKVSSSKGVVMALTEQSMTTIETALATLKYLQLRNATWDKEDGEKVVAIDAALAELAALRAKPDAQVDTTAPLVSDDRIIQRVYDLTYATESAEVLHAVRQIMYELRDEYEADRKRPQAEAGA